MELEVLAAESWAAEVADRLTAGLRARPALRLCLPTGETPRPLYAEVSGRVAAGDVTVRDATVFLLDEFGVAPDHPARCDTALRRALLDHVDLPRDSFERLDPCAADLEAECRRYAGRVAAGGLDLVLLGLGRNGHVGLNEPGSSPDDPTRRVDLDDATVEAAVRSAPEADPPTWGLTLGLAEMLAASEIWLLVTGTAKRDVLQGALADPARAQVPASFLRRHPNARVIADDRAAPAG